MNFLASWFIRVSLQNIKKPPSEPNAYEKCLHSVTLIVWASTQIPVGDKKFFSSQKCPGLPQLSIQWIPGFLAGVKVARVTPFSCLHGVD